ncbi:MAG TPA: DUF423 domain-containing protein [Cyclobacteriaceae bacterium]
MTHKIIFLTGCVFSFLSIVIGAFGAHALEDILIERGLKETYQTGVFYHVFHAIAILVLGILQKSSPHRLISLVAYLMILGILLFSGSLYVLSITGIKQLGIITPFGGLVLMISWCVLLFYGYRKF